MTVPSRPHGSGRGSSPMRKDSPMDRHRLMWLIFATLVVIPAAAFAGTNVSWSVTVGNAPPPPAIEFRHEPRLVVVPGSTVYVLDDACDYDVFRYGVFWYVFDDGYWYRARTYRGPFVVVSARYVPAAMSNVPAKYWRHPHGGPPGQWKKRNNYVAEREGHKRKVRD